MKVKTLYDAWQDAEKKVHVEQEKPCGTFDEWRSQQYVVMNTEFAAMTAKLEYEVELHNHLGSISYPFDHKPGSLEAIAKKVLGG